MKCREFGDCLADYAAGSLAPAPQGAADAHLASCGRCRSLLEIVLGRVEPLSPEEGAELTQSILARTSGSACPTAVSKLVDYVDQALSTEDTVLVAGHLESCPNCRALAGILFELGEELPGLAVLEPDARFLGDVLRDTLLSRRVSRHRNSFGQWMQELLLRPKFPLEAAYVGTLLIALVFASPLSVRELSAQPLSGAENRLRGMFDSASQVAAQRWNEAAVRADRVKGGLVERIQSHRRTVQDAAGEVADKMESLSGRARRLNQQLTSHVGQIWQEWLGQEPAQPLRQSDDHSETVSGSNQPGAVDKP